MSEDPMIIGTHGDDQEMPINFSHERKAAIQTHCWTLVVRQYMSGRYKFEFGYHTEDEDFYSYMPKDKWIANREHAVILKDQFMTMDPRAIPGWAMVTLGVNLG